MTASLQGAVASLSRLGCKPTKSSDGYIAFCPIHETDGKSHKQSLTIAKGDKQAVLVNCHAGCDSREILKLLGINGTPRATAAPVAVYHYQDENGQEVRQKIRFEPKDFRIRHQNAAGEWVYKAGDGPAVLYRLPEVMAAITEGRTIFVCEGEKDADRLVSLGLVTTTNIEGAAQPNQRAKWKTEYTTQLEGASCVVLLPDNDGPGKAHMAHIAKELAGKVSDVRVVELPGLPPKGDVSDWLKAGHSADELQALANEIPQQAPTDQAIDLDPYRGTDEANAVLFLEQHGADVRYCPPWEKWLIWTGSHWRIDDRLDVPKLVGNLPSELYRRAAEATDSGKRRAIAGLAHALENTRKQASLLLAARCRVVVHHSDLDKGRFLLNATNGTVDLETGKLRQHRRADLITHDTEIPYDPAATCPVWERFLSVVLRNDAELIAFVQRAIGYSLTGSVAEQVLLICYGSGSNGKSVFLNILRKLLGTLALQAAPDLLMADRNRRHPTEQADLFGKRLVVCQETAEGRRFNEVLVKQLTGGDAIRARRMQEDFWEFNPTHKLWLATNHRPEIKGTDHAIWRRPRLIPFDVQFTVDGEHRKDPAMEDRLTAELPGIFAWAVRGCLDWQREGLGNAQAVTEATEAYRADMDVLAAWISECCIVGKAFEAKASVLYKSYTDWCEQSGETAQSQTKWGMRLTERGLRRDRRMAGFFWVGIGLIDPNSMNPMNPYEPKKAVLEQCIETSSKTAKSGSYGSYRSCSPDTGISSHQLDESPPVDTDDQGRI